MGLIFYGLTQTWRRLHNIVLIHLSNGSSDEQRFVNEIKRLTGKQVTAADKGVEIELSIPY